jgi:hypothetical protein
MISQAVSPIKRLRADSRELIFALDPCPPGGIL